MLGRIEGILKEHVHCNRTPEHRANQLFRSKQGKSENVSEWIQKLGSKFREATHHDCEIEDRAGILRITDKSRTFGLFRACIQTEYKLL
jgi:hypothetical protein